jgi:hypothetical protein
LIAALLKNCFRVQLVLNRRLVNLIAKLKSRFADKAEPEHLRHGKLGELAAKVPPGRISLLCRAL